MKKSTRYEMRDTRYENGSALILVVVLTSLLAIVGVMFVMVARVDKIATSAISENKTLDYAVEAVIAKISQELVLDVPGVAVAEYYDYPGQRDKWLASLEPHKDSGYKWRQISDVTGYINQEWGSSSQEKVTAEIVGDHEEIELDSNGDIESSPEQLADADGDGVADSKWIELEGINSSKGKTIFAAVRVIDNGGMLNVNTARQFNPNSVVKNEIDGSNQTQIDLLALSERGSTPNPLGRLDDVRYGLEPHNLNDYIRDVVWRYYVPDGEYTPFDISDELEMRSRFLLNRPGVDSRVEEVWDHAFQWPNASVPIGSGSLNLNDWLSKVQYDWSEPNAPNDYSYRHIGTTYNMDRIINPVGVVFNNGKMVNVNKDGAGLIYSAIKQGIDVDPNFYDVNDIAAQTAVNLIDFRDNDSDVTPLPDVNGITYYGFERPCVYISELAHRFVKLTIPTAPIRFTIRKSYAVELYKPYLKDKYPDANQWRLSIEGYSGSPIEIDWSGTKHFHVILFEDPCAPLEDDVDFDLADKDPCFAPSFVILPLSHNTVVFDVGKTVRLERRVDDVNDVWIAVDSPTVPVPDGEWWAIDGEVHSIRRDITLHKCIRRLWSAPIDGSTLGGSNNYADPSTAKIQAHPENEPFTNVGEIGMVFREDVYRRNWDSTDTEADVRLNLADPNYHNIFKYLTVFDPSSDNINNDGDYKDGFENTDEIALDETPEFKIPGRININTAPWYVIAQLPWVSYDEDNPGTADYRLAQAIVAYRDKLETPVDYSDPNTGNTGRYDVIKNKIPSWVDQNDIREELGFASIGELALVLRGSTNEYNRYSIDRFSKDGGDLDDFPDLTPNDKAEDDFEERDVIFARLSNLVTVRSDVFTAYILVRIGADGPQKRVMAILDRSNVYTGDGRVQIVALHAVADPR